MEDVGGNKKDTNEKNKTEKNVDTKKEETVCVLSFFHDQKHFSIKTFNQIGSEI